MIQLDPSLPLYTTGDIAKICGVSRPAASNWYARNQLPEPALRTAGGTGLWTEDQVLQIAEEYEEFKQQQARIRALREQIKAERKA